MQSLLVPAAVLAVVAAFAAHRALTRRRVAKMKVSGGRKALVRNIMERDR